MKRYEILNRAGRKQLAEEVAAYVDFGYIPCGGIFLYVRSGFFQSVYLPLDKDLPKKLLWEPTKKKMVQGEPPK